MSTELAPFRPKGDLPEWRLVYDALPREIGALITFNQLDDALGRNFRDNRQPIYRAQRELLEVDKFALAPVMGKGYRIVEPREHVDLAHKDRRSARRRMAKAVAKVVNVHRTALTPAERDRLERNEIALKRQAQALARLADKVDQHQKRLDVHTAELDQVPALRSQVERLQQALEQRGFLKEENEKT